jgi:HK97 gp10 family phage protein
MSFKIETDAQSKKVLLSLEKMGQTTQRALRRAFYFSGKDLVKESSRLIMEKPKHGRLYKLQRNGVSVLHRASAPGEAPANFTGALKSSLDFTVIGHDRMLFGSREQFLGKGGQPVELKTRKGVVYGKFLEEGTGKMAPRPFLITSLNNSAKQIEQNFVEQIIKNIDETTKA